MSLLRRRAMMEENGGDGMREWKLIGSKEFSEADKGIGSFGFECDGCTEFFICDNDLISNQDMGYGIAINDIRISVNHKVRTTSGKRYREVCLEYKGNRWCETDASFDYEALTLQNLQVVMGDKNIGVGVANKISIIQSTVSGYEIYSGTIEIWGR